MSKIKLGDTVKCIHTGFKGVVVARTEYINGCIQLSVVPKISDLKKDEYPEEVGIDETSLEVVKKKKKKVIKKDPEGGATRAGPSMRGF